MLLQAVAIAFAEGFATATNKCFIKCRTDKLALSETIATILVTATSKSMAGQCTGVAPFPCT